MTNNQKIIGWCLQYTSLMFKITSPKVAIHIDHAWLKQNRTISLSCQQRFRYAQLPAFGIQLCHRPESGGSCDTASSHSPLDVYWRWIQIWLVLLYPDVLSRNLIHRWHYGKQIIKKRNANIDYQKCNIISLQELYYMIISSIFQKHSTASPFY